MKEASRKGAVLLALLLVMPLVAAASIYLHRLKISSARREQIVNRTVRNTSRGLIPPIQRAIQLPASFMSSSSPFLLFDDLSRSSAYLLRLNGLSGAIPIPSWQRLSSLPTISCSSSSPEAVTHPSKAPNTCSGINAPITTNSFSAYNINQMTPLTVHALPNTSLTIAIAGELSSPVHLNLGDASQVEIVALGSVIIGALSVTTSLPNSNAAVLIYSRLGNVTVSLPAGINLCDSNSTAGTGIRIEAAHGISVDGIPRAGPATGCDIARSAYFWPKSQVLGVYYQ